MPLALITGANGFIATHLADKLIAMGWEIAGVGHAPQVGGTAPSPWVIQGDLCDETLTAAVTGKKPDVVFHLAGGSSVARSVEAPLLDFQKTVLSTANLMDWVRRNAPLTRVVLASSAAVYGEGNHSPDKDPQPCSPYGYHKAMAENLLREYGHLFGTRSAAVRLFSVYGEGLRKQLLWDICRRLAVGEREIFLGGTGNEERDWIHVTDAATHLIEAASHATEQVPISDGGSGRPTSIREMADLICSAWGSGHKPVFSGIQRKGDPHRLVAQSRCSESRSPPTVSLSEGVTRYVDWFRTTL